MKDSFLSVFRCLFLLMASITLHIEAEPAEAFDSPLVRLPGYVSNKPVAKAIFLKNLDTSVHVPVTFTLPLRNQKELEELVQRIHDPADKEHYGKYLTSEEFVDRFAPSQEDYDKVIAYTKSLGLDVSHTHPNRTLLNVKGSAGSIESAFKLCLQQYALPKGRTFYSPDNDPAVPVSIASIISGIEGLDTRAVWRPFHERKEITKAPHVPHAYPSGPGGGYSPSDLITAYNLAGVPANGSGQIVALFELASYQVSDINTYTTFFGLPAARLHNILVDGGSSEGINAEVTLDIELVLAFAPQSQIYVYEGPNTNQGVLDTYNRIATDNIAKQVSTSWGLAEDLVYVQYLRAENAIFLQMAAQGQSMYAAAGDSGAYDDPNKASPVVDDPASQPYVVGVGGTRLTVNPVTCAYGSESCWNNGRGNGAGGGGVSAVWPIPSWQTTVSTAYSHSYRNVPDVALNADPSTGYSIYFDGQWVIYGGTSCGAPLWAGFTALVNQERTTTQKPALGFANPPLYAIGASASYAANFHDITNGNNLYYPSKQSYDNATGWGSLNGAHLFTSLTNTSITPPLPPPTLSPLLNITMTHSSPFVKNKTGIYNINVSNQGSGKTSGTVTVAVTLPKGLTYSSFIGPGWTFNKSKLTFTRSNTLNSGSSYSPIALKVNVSSKASSPVITTATVSGGGSVSSTVTDLTIVR